MEEAYWENGKIMQVNGYILGWYYAIILTLVRGLILAVGLFVQLYIIHLKIIMGLLFTQPNTFFMIILMCIGFFNLVIIILGYPTLIGMHLYQIVIMIIGGVGPSTDIDGAPISLEYMWCFGWEQTYLFQKSQKKKWEKQWEAGAKERERQERIRKEQSRQYWEDRKQEEEWKARAFYEHFKEQFKRDFAGQGMMGNHEESGLPRNFAEACVVLEVSEGLTKTEYKQAYRKKALEYHSDQFQGVGEKIRKLAEEEMKRINAAWDIINKEMPG